MNEVWPKVIAAIVGGGLIAMQAGTHVKLNDVASEVYPRSALDERHDAHDMWRDVMETRMEMLEKKQLDDEMVNSRVRALEEKIGER